MQAVVAFPNVGPAFSRQPLFDRHECEVLDVFVFFAALTFELLRGAAWSFEHRVSDRAPCTLGFCWQVLCQAVSQITWQEPVVGHLSPLTFAPMALDEFGGAFFLTLAFQALERILAQ